MFIGLIKMLGKDKLNAGDYLHLLEASLVIIILIYTTYNNAKEVPVLKDSVASVQTRVTALETGQSDMKHDLDDIKNSLGRIETALLGRR